MIQKHRWLKLPVMAIMAVELSVYYAGLKLASNARRFSCAALLFLLLVVSSSFSYSESLKNQTLATLFMETDGVLLTEELTVDSEQMASIEAQGLEGYDDPDLMEEEEMSFVSLEEILENNAGYEDRIDTQNRTGAETDYSDYVFDTGDWRLILVNTRHPIPDDYEFPLGNISASMYCDERILDDLLAMLAAARADNVDIQVCSPYRDYDRQLYLFNRKIIRYMDAGMSYIEAYKKASIAVTIPNSSEHQLGLAVDLYASTYTQLNEGFAQTKTGIWLAEHCYQYGFILRYPEGKEYITGIEYEPWHFRYVGIEAATVITERGLTLEEFWEEIACIE